ncbi:GDP-mannose 4,6 dehydratase [Collichthys lucidus]|uniref:GDP-mannose 4,6-dehydratase n=1 Tax=Collichthys lucidus TaxID=240159 RepID=A0A4U5UL43_COLLU|nr:GDP-mannose 4,6 dehydratase [Collichthys lucidus]
MGPTKLSSYFLWPWGGCGMGKQNQMMKCFGGYGSVCSGHQGVWSAASDSSLEFWEWTVAALLTGATTSPSLPSPPEPFNLSTLPSVGSGRAGSGGARRPRSPRGQHIRDYVAHCAGMSHHLDGESSHEPLGPSDGAGDTESEGGECEGARERERERGRVGSFPAVPKDPGPPHRPHLSACVTQYFIIVVSAYAEKGPQGERSGSGEPSALSGQVTLNDPEIGRPRLPEEHSITPAMWLMLQKKEPEDFVIATGEVHSVREFVEKAFKHVGKTIVWEGKDENEVGRCQETGVVHVRVDPKYFRPTEVKVSSMCNPPNKATTATSRGVVEA